MEVDLSHVNDYERNGNEKGYIVGIAVRKVEIVADAGIDVIPCSYLLFDPLSYYRTSLRIHLDVRKRSGIVE